MLVSTLNSTYMLVAILRYDCVTRDVPFEEFWQKRCESDWKRALRAFSLGVPLFMVVVAVTSWLKFWGTTGGFISGVVVSVIALVFTAFWFGGTARKWTGFLLSSDARLTRRISHILTARSLTLSSRDGENRNDDSSQE